MDKEPQVGRRYTACCCQDASQICDEEDLIDIIETQEDMLDDLGYLFYTFYETKEELIEAKCSCSGECSLHRYNLSLP